MSPVRFYSDGIMWQRLNSPEAYQPVITVIDNLVHGGNTYVNAHSRSTDFGYWYYISDDKIYDALKGGTQKDAYNRKINVKSIHEAVTGLSMNTNSAKEQIKYIPFFPSCYTGKDLVITSANNLRNPALSIPMRENKIYRLDFDSPSATVWIGTIASFQPIDGLTLITKTTKEEDTTLPPRLLSYDSTGSIYISTRPGLPDIKDVIFNAPATIVKWKDGTKTVVKCGEKDEYDAEKGLALCIAKKALGNKGNYYNQFAKWLPEKMEETDSLKRRLYVECHRNEILDIMHAICVAEGNPVALTTSAANIVKYILTDYWAIAYSQKDQAP